MLLDCILTSTGMLMGMTELNPLHNFIFMYAGILGIISMYIIAISSVYFYIPRLLKKGNDNKEYRQVSIMCMILAGIIGIVQISNIFNIARMMLL